MRFYLGFLSIKEDLLVRLLCDDYFVRTILIAKLRTFLIVSFLLISNKLRTVTQNYGNKQQKKIYIKNSLYIHKTTVQRKVFDFLILFD